MAELPDALRVPALSGQGPLRLVVRHLLRAGETPCGECWEQYSGLPHTSSLAAVSAGQTDHGTLLADMAAPDWRPARGAVTPADTQPAAGLRGADTGLDIAGPSGRVGACLRGLLSQRLAARSRAQDTHFVLLAERPTVLSASTRLLPIVLVSAAVVALGATMLPLFVVNRQPGATNLVVGLVLMLAGADLVATSATRLSGALMVAAGVAWFIPDAAPALPRVLAVIVEHCSLVHVALLVAAMLASTRVDGFDTWQIAALSTSAAAAASALVGGHELLVPLAGAALLIAGFRRAAVLKVVAGWRRWSFVAAVGLTSAALIGVSLARSIGGVGDEPLLFAFYAYGLAFGAVALALAGGWSRVVRVLDVGPDGLSSLDGLVKTLTRDPGARVAVAVERGRWVGLDGSDVSLATTGPEAEAETVRVLSSPRPSASALARFDEALTLAARAVRLRDDGARDLRSLRRLRRRLVSVEDDERSRLEARLRAGPIERLGVIADDLRAAGASPEFKQRLQQVRAEIDPLARGLDPLSGVRLDQAVEAMALDAGASCHVEQVTLGGAQARALYFAGAEGLANAAKHAPRATLVLRLSSSSGLAVLRVTDDGGPSSPAQGTGLRDLADRMAAVGGSLTVEHGPGGTTLTATAPQKRTSGQHVEECVARSDAKDGPPFVAFGSSATEVDPCTDDGSTIS